MCDGQKRENGCPSLTSAIICFPFYSIWEYTYIQKRNKRIFQEILESVWLKVLNNELKSPWCIIQLGYFAGYKFLTRSSQEGMLFQMVDTSGKASQKSLWDQAAGQQPAIAANSHVCVRHTDGAAWILMSSVSFALLGHQHFVRRENGPAGPDS